MPSQLIVLLFISPATQMPCSRFVCRHGIVQWMSEQCFWLCVCVYVCVWCLCHSRCTDVLLISHQFCIISTYYLGYFLIHVFIVIYILYLCWKFTLLLTWMLLCSILVFGNKLDQSKSSTTDMMASVPGWKLFCLDLKWIQFSYFEVQVVVLKQILQQRLIVCYCPCSDVLF